MPAKHQDVEEFIETASTILAPVYAPLADQIVSDFDLANKEGIGIDLGSGPGHLIVELCRRTEKMHWVNADINPRFFPYFIEAAEKAGFDRRVSATYADAEALPFHDGYADIVVSRGSFQFWQNWERGILEIYRVLKPGGVAFVGRGFSENLPVEVARQIRSRQRERGFEPGYDVSATVAELKRIVKILAIEDFKIRIPRPPAAQGLNYGIWLEFYKPPYREKRPPRLLDMPDLESSGLEPATSTVTRAQIEKQGSKNVIDALQYVPGAWVETRGRKVKQFFSVRGQRYPYPEYAVDGALFREFHEVPYVFSAGDVERIEVLRSSAAMLNGTTGLSGIVNIVPREYPERETSWLAEYGSLNTYRVHVSHGGPAGDKVSYGLGFDGFNTDGPQGRHGAEKSANLFANVTWTPNQVFLVRASVFHIEGRRELVQAVPPAAERFQTALERFDPIKATVATVKTLIQPNDWATTQFIIGYSNRRNTFIAETENSHESSRDWDSEWSMNLIQSLALMRNNVFRIGANYSNWVAPYGKRFYSGRRSDLETYSATLADEHRFGRLLLDGAFRYQKTYINEYGAFNIDGSPQGFKTVDPILNQWEPPILSGSLGASYSLTGNVSLYGNFLAGSLEPRRGTLDTEFNTPKKEQRTTTDLGIRFARPQFGELSLVGFYTKQKDAIVLSGETETLNGRIMELYENRDQDSKGLEFDFSSRPVVDTFSIFFNLVAMRSDADLDGAMRQNPEIPELIIGAGFLGWKWGWDFNLFWKHISSYQSKRFVAPPVYKPIGDFHSVNLTAGHNFGSSEQLRLYLEIRNLTDAEFSTVVGYPDYGRRFLVGIRHRF